MKVEGTLCLTVMRLFLLCRNPPRGRWLALGVCVQSPTGVGSYKKQDQELSVRFALHQRPGKT